MITIDRDDALSIQDQLIEQVRFQIASGRYRVGETLPSTRALAEQVDVSFHTVRKAYQVLQEEGLVDARPGRGYVILERQGLSKEARMERGAEIANALVQRMIGIGLSDAEMQYLIDEQVGLLDRSRHRHKILFAAPYLELAHPCAQQLRKHIQQPVDAVRLSELPRHEDADLVIVPFQHLSAAMTDLPRVDVHGVVTYLHHEALQHVSRLLEHESVGIVSRYPEAIQPLMARLRNEGNFAGQMLGASIEDGSRHLRQFAEQVDTLLFTSFCKRSIRMLDSGAARQVELEFVVAGESLQDVLHHLPG